MELQNYNPMIFLDINDVGDKKPTDNLQGSLTGLLTIRQGQVQSTFSIPSSKHKLKLTEGQTAGRDYKLTEGIEELFVHLTSDAFNWN